MHTPEPLDDAAAAPPSPRNHILFGSEGLRAGWTLLLFVLLMSLLGALSNHLLRAVLPHSVPAEQPVSRVLLLDGVFFGSVLLVSIVVSLLERRPLRSYGLGATPHALRQFVVGLIVGLVVLSLLVGALLAGHLIHFGGVLLAPAAAVQFGVLWLLAFLLVGLAEEYLLRGLLQFTLARGLAGIASALHMPEPRARALGFWIAAVFFSFVFGFGHHSNPGESSVGLLSAGLIGLVFCLSLWRTGSLWWAVGFHTAWDWAQSFVYGTPDSGGMMQHHLLASTPMGPVLWSGGLTGPEGSLLVLPTILLIAVAVILTTKRAVTTPSRPPEPAATRL